VPDGICSVRLHTALSLLVILVSALLLRFWWVRVRLLLRGDASDVVAVLGRDSKASMTFWQNCRITFFGPDLFWI